jgi:nicotinamidase-related amidase
MRKILIVVDMQNDFITDALGSPEAQAIVPNVKNKIEEYLSRGDKVIFTRDTHHDNYLKSQEGKKLPVTHCIEGTHGWEVVSAIDNPECQHLNKLTFGYMGWDLRLDKPEEIELVGVCTDICVVSNALILRATFREAEITVDASCCAGTTPENHNAALQVMKCCQINVIGE